MAISTRQKIFYPVIGLSFLIYVSCKDDKDNILQDEMNFGSSFNDTAVFGWNEFYKNGRRIRSELLKVEGEPFVNQVIKFHKSGEIDSLNSKFFEIELNDTLEVGTNMGIATLYTYNKPFEARTSSVIIENTYPDGTVKMDTFVGDYRNLKFGIFASTEGYREIQGKISEIILIKKKNEEFLKLKLTSYFEKKVFIEQVPQVTSMLTKDNTKEVWAIGNPKQVDSFKKANGFEWTNHPYAEEMKTTYTPTEQLPEQS